MATANSRRNKDARKDDLYTTPPWATEALLKREKFEGSVLDAGCGLNHITNVLVNHGYDVGGIDLNDHGFGVTGIDFTIFNEMQDNVISNPPFTLLTQFITKANEIAVNKVAIFARINALETLSRYEEIYKDNPPNRVYLFANRVNCPKGGDGDEGGSAVLYCWLIWDKHEKLEGTRLLWLTEVAPKKLRKKKAKKLIEFEATDLADEIENDVTNEDEIIF